MRWTWNPVEDVTGYEAVPYLAGTPPDQRNLRLYVEEPSVRVEGLEPRSEVGIHVRAVRETAGGRAAGPWSDGVYAETWGQPRECTNEYAFARAFADPLPLLDEWDGTPFLFYFARESVPEDELADAQHAMDIVERMSALIEDQIGYSVIEVGGWTQNGLECRADDADSRVSGRIVAYVSPETEPNPVPPNVLVTADVRCARVKYWNGTVTGRRDPTIVHEIFHLFGFTHSPDPLQPSGAPHPWQTPPGIGYPMSAELTGSRPQPELGPTWDDTDALRCILEGAQ